MAKRMLIIRPLSPFRTPLQSDTFFGHVCWAMRYIYGEQRLIDFLAAFGDDYAPLLLSNGFPRGYLPMPVLRPPDENEETAIMELCRDRLDFLREIKRLKKVPYVKAEVFDDTKDGLSYYNLYRRHLVGEILLEYPEDGSRPFVEVQTWHNTKNRLSDRVLTGGLFSKKETFYHAGMELCIYMEDLYFDKHELYEMIEFISRSGYGADKSIGRGLFDFEMLDDWDLPAVQEPNAFITLSNYHPRKGEFIDGYYTIKTKFGKIGGHWASGVDGGPHKLPILMLEPGSTLKAAEPNRPFYGGLIPNVHKKQGVVHYGIALPLKVRVV